MKINISDEAIKHLVKYHYSTKEEAVVSLLETMINFLKSGSTLENIGIYRPEIGFEES
jgi:hypothetical protein